jgi:hypothetical protein
VQFLAISLVIFAVHRESKRRSVIDLRLQRIFLQPKYLKRWEAENPRVETQRDSEGSMQGAAAPRGDRRASQMVD